MKSECQILPSIVLNILKILLLQFFKVLYPWVFHLGFWVLYAQKPRGKTQKPGWVGFFEKPSWVDQPCFKYPLTP